MKRSRLVKYNLLNILLCLILNSCHNSEKLEISNFLGTSVSASYFDKKGVSFVAMNAPVVENDIKILSTIGCTWVSQMPFAYCQIGKTDIAFGQVWQWWGETDKGVVETTRLCREKGIKTMMKPQIWMDGIYTGKFFLKTDSDWKIWEKNYQNFIFHFAKLSDSLNIEIFCIGTELDLSTQMRPQFWDKLIDSVKTMYKGKLTYAANWNDYQNVSFWNKLDFIGIDAYFPLSLEKTPKVAEMVESWKLPLDSIDRFRQKLNKPVLFTEIGYKSVDATAQEPWNPKSETLNLTAQKNAIQAFFHVFGNKTWFEGVFFWKWYPKQNESGGINDLDYTPQNKPAQEMIKRSFLKK